MIRQEILPQFSGTKPSVTFDFTDQLQGTDTIDPNGIGLNCVVYSGTDPSPTPIVSATPTHTSTTVTQLLNLQDYGVQGTIYIVTCNVATLAGNIYAKEGYLAVLPEFP